MPQAELTEPAGADRATRRTNNHCVATPPIGQTAGKGRPRPGEHNGHKPKTQLDRAVADVEVAKG
jgi:hypothetical protein